MSTYDDQWSANVSLWLDQRSGSSKKHKDSMPSKEVLMRAQQRILSKARELLETADKLSTLINLRDGEL